MLASATDPPFPRRLAAIAFADVVGYSILAAADENRAAARWMAMFHGRVKPEAGRRGGRIVDVQGDGVLAEFPDVPAALAWAEALHAASEALLQAEPDEPPIAFRVAIHLGHVMVDGPLILGDAVNLAARLQEYGQAGGTILTESAASALPREAVAAARDMGDLPLRNLSRAVRALSLDPVRRVPVPLPPAPATLPSIAVLPFENQGEDPRDDYLASGIVEDVAISLAGLQEVFVIAPDSASLFARQKATPQRIGRTLGVRFVAMGTLRRAGGGIRASVRLVDTQSGEQLWGERFDVAEREIFDVQDYLVERIVAGIVPNIHAVVLREAMRKRPESLTAYDHMLRGVHALRAQNKEGMAASRAHLARAMATDPGFALPMAWTARWHALHIGLGWSTDRLADIEAAAHHAQTALDLEPKNSLALAVFGHVAGSFRKQFDVAEDYFDRALSISPGNAQAWMFSSGLLSYLGRGVEAVDRGRRGVRLSPYDPMRFLQYHFLSIAHYATGDLQAAAREARVSVGNHVPHASAWRMLAAILAGLGEFEDAQTAMRRLLEIERNFSLARYVRGRMPFRDPDLRSRVEQDLRRAGAPD
jgi:adenylate cyclase